MKINKGLSKRVFYKAMVFNFFRPDQEKIKLLDMGNSLQTVTTFAL
jgi:hypothetical protein